MSEYQNVIWITGMSACGKTTLANLVVEQYKFSNKNAIWLDGDDLREALCISNSFDKSARLELAFKYAGIAKMLANQGFLVVVSTVALHHEIHDWNRKNLPGYFEVFIKCDLAELKRRDPKGLYKGYEDGKISNIAGLDMSAEFPSKPDLIIASGEFTDPNQSKELVVQKFEDWRKGTENEFNLV